MIRYSLLLSAFCFLHSVYASTNLSLTLQQALFEEEANHNLPAAIQSYQALVSQHDQDRKLAGTAVFRLGECYRKQGNKNDAAAQYERVIRDFSDQSTLVSLSRQSLSSLGFPAPSAQLASSTAARQEQKRLLEEEIKLVEKQLAAEQNRVDVGVASRENLLPIERDLLKLRRQLVALDAGDTLVDMRLPNGVDGAAVNDAERLALEKKIAELKALPKEKLRVAIQQSFPNPVLNSLMEQFVVAEQRLAAAEKEYGPEHTEVLKAKAIIETVSKQIDAQVDAAIEGLEIKRSALTAASHVSGSAPPSTASTSAEAEEERRIKALIKDSPDLINSSSIIGLNGESQTLLQDAAAKGRLSIVKLLLENGAAIDGVRQFAVTPLHYAAFNGHKTVVDFLLSKGAKANARTEQGVTPLHLAALKGYEFVAASLLKAGAPVNARVRSQENVLGYGFSSGETPLRSAVNAGYPAVVQTLLSSGADPNTVATDGRTPLSSCAERGDDTIAKILLAAHADPNAGSRNLPLFEAARRGDPALLELFLSHGADPNTNSVLFGRGGANQSAPPLYVAVANRQPQAITILARHKADPNMRDAQGNSLIFDALGHTDTLKALLDAGADPNRTLSDGTSPLLRAVSNKDKLDVEILLAHKADPNLETTQNRTMPLHAATFYGSTEIAELLLKSGSEVNARDYTGATPLHIAVQHNRTEIVELLLANNADPNLRNNSGQTPLDVSKQSFSQPGVPGLPPPQTFSTRLAGLSTPGVVSPAASESKSPQLSIADILRKHGASDEVPDFDVIRVMRKGAGPWVAFRRDGPNSFNHFTLLETLASAAQFNLQYPAFAQIRIHRPDPAKAAAWKEIAVNPMLTPSTFDCAKDVPLEFGDVVEIPEREHTLTEAANYLPGGALSESFQKCLTRKAKFVVRDQTVELPLSGNNSDTFLSSALQRQTVRDVLRSSSDFSRIRVKRTDPDSKKVSELTIDVQSIWDGKRPRTDDLWLRDGDLIEVPDKSK